MPQVATPNLLEVVVQITSPVGSNPMYNIFHISKIGPNGPAAAAAITNINAFYTAIKGYYRTGCSIVSGYKVVDRGSVPWTLVPASSVSVSGTGAVGAVAAQLAMVVSWRTLTVGKSYRGRTFLGPFDATGSAGATWSGAMSTAVANAAVALMNAGLTSGVYTPVVYSAKQNVATQITSLTTSTAMRTLRSRA